MGPLPDGIPKIFNLIPMDQQHKNIMIASGTPVALLAKAVCEVSHPPRVTQDQELVIRHRHSQHRRFRPSATVTCRHGPH